MAAGMFGFLWKSHGNTLNGHSNIFGSFSMAIGINGICGMTTRMIWFLLNVHRKTLDC